MKIKIAAQNFLEWIALKTNLFPLPLVHTQIYPMLAKAILEAHSQNVFEALKNESKTIEQIAAITRLDKSALNSLLNVLIALGYLRLSKNEYVLTSLSKKWCLKNSLGGLYHQQMFNELSWNWINHLGGYLKTGKGLQYHETLNPDEWALYQKGMENIAGIAAKSIMKLAPKLYYPHQMLDIGGSHGLFSLEYIKKYPSLKATVLELPAAIEKAESLLRKHYNGTQIEYRPGNALTDDFGEEEYDIILIASLMHHFTKEQKYDLTKKVYRALKKCGYFIIQEFLRPKPSANMEIAATVMDLFFNLSSTGGTAFEEEYINFQISAGLKHIAIKKFITIPGLVQVIGRKS